MLRRDERITSSMKWQVQHCTRFDYASAARESFNQLHLQPANDETQTVEMFALDTSPHASLRDYRDFYGNIVHYFEVPQPHDSLAVQSSIQAVTRPRPFLAEDALTYRLKSMGEAPLSVRGYEFLQASTYVSLEPEVWRLALDAINGTEDVWQAAVAIARFVPGFMAYSSNSTSSHTHMRDALKQRRGVCQDMAHLALGLCRAIQIPALYVSGYLATERANATHAWIEVFIPEIGWQALDPTHGRQPDEAYLKIAIGRDYDDVAPIKGQYKGSSERRMEVLVNIQAGP